MQTSIFWSFPESGNGISGSISFQSSVTYICPICCLQWIDPAQPLSTQQPFLPAGAGRESEEKKRKTHGSRWQFSKCGNGKKKEQWYKSYNSPLPTSRLMPSWSPSKGHFGKTFIGQHDVVWHGTSLLWRKCIIFQPDPVQPYFDFISQSWWRLFSCPLLFSSAQYRRYLAKCKVPFYWVEGNGHT